MEPNEMTRVFRVVKEKLPSSSDDDLMKCWALVSAMDFAHVEQAAKELGIATKDKRVDPERLAAIAGRMARQVAERLKVPSQTIRDLHKGEKRFEAMDDEAMLATHFTEAWNGVDSPEVVDWGRQRVRAAIYRHAVAAFTSIGISDADADVKARACVGLKPGEAMMKKPEVVEQVA